MNCIEALLNLYRYRFFSFDSMGITYVSISKSMSIMGVIITSCFFGILFSRNNYL